MTEISKENKTKGSFQETDILLNSTEEVRIGM